MHYQLPKTPCLPNDYFLISLLLVWNGIILQYSNKKTKQKENKPCVVEEIAVVEDVSWYGVSEGGGIRSLEF